jgi:hypothetical protein
MPYGVAVGAPMYAWTTGGDAPWFGQTHFTLKAGAALQTGRILQGQRSWLQTTITGPGALKFYWRSSTYPNYNVLWLYANNQLLGGIEGYQGLKGNWEPAIVELPAGNFTFRGEYAKTSSVLRGEDACWLEGVALFKLASTNTPVPVPYWWLDDFYPDIDPDISAPAIGANGIPVWHSYVAGLDPTSSNSHFTANISIINSVPHITWKPDLGKDRAYTIEGKANLSDAAWHSPTNSASRFFRVNVEMPKY